MTGMVGVLAGTLAARELVPADYGVPGAMTTAGAAMAAGLLVAPVLALIRQPLAIFRIENLVQVGLVYWLLLDLIQGSYPLYETSYESVRSGLLAIGLFAGAFWVGSLAGSQLRPPRFIQSMARQDLSTKAVFGMAIAAFTLAMLRFAIPCDFDPVRMVDGLLTDRFSAPWSRGAEGGWGAFIDHLSYFGYLSPTLTVVLVQRLGRWSDPRVFICIVMSVVITLFLMQGGGRRVIGTMYGAALMCWMLQHGGRLKARHLFAMIGAAAALLVVMEVMLEFRSSGFSRFFQSEDIEIQTTTLRVDDNFLRLCQLIDLIPARYPFVEEKQYTWTLVRPVPRVLWPGKPLNPGFDLGEAVGKRGTSLTSSVIGEFYMSYGWVTIALGGLLYGILAGACSRVLMLSDKPARLVVYGLSAIAIFTGLRSMIELVLMSYALLAWIGLSTFVRPANPAGSLPVRR
jgi:oligosaccharide repeat unit polymerase